VQRTLSEIRRLNELADDLLVLDSLEAGGSVALDVSVQPVDAKEIIDRSIDAVKTLAELKGVGIKYGNANGADNGVKVTADPARSVQIVVNLLSNAIKFSPDKSHITVTEETDNGFARIVVSDNGRGIPDEEQSKVFARFDQVVEGDRKIGSGLGLFISRKLAEAQGGALEFSSQVGVGSKFWLSLPLASDLNASQAN
ncbi:MAG: HAMP domain-containing histidine kinase, partial [Cyanobacteria bacterium]|nr:HAMP domain-containing histidine kinase [Cyanobacteriota bacterium]